VELTNKGLFELCNLPETFQWINSILWELLHEEVLANYINNFVIYQNQEGTRKKNNMILKYDRETQSLFQTVKVWFYC